MLAFTLATPLPIIATYDFDAVALPKSQSISQYIDIVSKDGENSRVYTLMIEGTAKTAVDFSSKRVKLDKIAGETSFSLSVRPSFDAVKLRDISVKSASGQLEIRSSRPAEDEKVLELQCVASSRNQDVTGESLAILTVESTSDKVRFNKEEHEIVLYSDIGWRVRPSQLSFRRDAESKRWRASALLLPPRDAVEAIKIGAVTLSGPSKEFSVDLVGQSKRRSAVVLDLELPADLTKDVLSNATELTFVVKGERILVSSQFFD